MIDEGIIYTRSVFKRADGSFINNATGTKNFSLISSLDKAFVRVEWTVDLKKLSWTQ